MSKENMGIILANKRNVAFRVLLLIIIVQMISMVWYATLPSSGRSGETECKNNLRQIKAALDAYSTDHDGRIVLDLEELLPKYLSNNEVLRCPEIESRSRIRQDAEELKADYVYLPLTTAKLASNPIQIFEKTAIHNHLNVIYFNGTSGLVSKMELTRQLEKTLRDREIDHIYLPIAVRRIEEWLSQ